MSIVNPEDFADFYGMVPEEPAYWIEGTPCPVCGSEDVCDWDVEGRPLRHLVVPAGVGDFG